MSPFDWTRQARAAAMTPNPRKRPSPMTGGPVTGDLDVTRTCHRRGERAKARDYYRRFLDHWGGGELDRDRVAATRAAIR
jgi:hypothetical protein